MIKYLIFDLDGVLFTSGATLVYDQLTSLLSLDKQKIKACLSESSSLGAAYRKGEITREVFWQKALAYWHKNYDWQKLNKLWLKSYQLKPEVYQIVQQLYQKGYRLGILSNIVEDRFAYLDKQAKLSFYFSAMVLSYQDHVLKPEKQAFELIIKRLKIKNTNKAVYIDDKEIHVNAALKLGLHALVFQNASQLKEDLKILGVTV